MRSSFTNPHYSPTKCKFCNGDNGNHELTYNSLIDDDCCDWCGEWQNEVGHNPPKVNFDTVSAKEHHKIMMAKYHNDCSKWQRNGGLDSFPQIAFYGYHRSYGYVAFRDGKSCWRKTKKEARNAFIENYG